jgi:hypothetical protein
MCRPWRDSMGNTASRSRGFRRGLEWTAPGGASEWFVPGGILEWFVPGGILEWFVPGGILEWFALAGIASRRWFTPLCVSPRVWPFISAP